MQNQFNPEVHRVVEVEQTRFLRREMKMEDIFTVYNLPTDVWTICVWTDKGRGLFRELRVLKSIRDLDKRTVWGLLEWAHKKTASLSEVKRERAAQQKRDLRRWAERNEDARDAKRFTGRWMKKKFGNIVGENPEWDRPGLPVTFGGV